MAGERQKLLDDLCRDFKIADARGLNTAIGNAIYAFCEHGAEAPDFREADTLDELADYLARAADLLRNPLNGNRLAQYWRGLPEAARRWLADDRDPGFALLDFRALLDVVQRVAADAHHDKAQARAALGASRSGPLPKADIRAALRLLVDYWDSLGHRFTYAPWAVGQPGRLEPVTDGERFCHRILQHFLPLDRADELRSIAREFTRTRGG